MMKAELAVASALLFAWGAALAGDRNSLGPGSQTNGSSTTTSGFGNAVAATAASRVVTSLGGVSALAASIGNLPGAVTAGNAVTSPPIVAGAMTVTISINTATGAITVTGQSGVVIFSTEGN